MQDLLGGPVLSELKNVGITPSLEGETEPPLSHSPSSFPMASPSNLVSSEPLHRIHSVVFYGIILLESCIFPIPPDPFFIVRALKNPKKVWALAALCTLLSTFGGCITYAIGLWFYDHWGPFLLGLCGGEKVFLTIQSFMHVWGAWAIVAKGFTPVPYKVIALISGVTHFSFPTFVLTSLVARGIRFNLLALFVHKYHERAKKILDQHQYWAMRILALVLAAGCGILFFQIQ